MKYLYGDSTEFPLKRDFLALLDNFIDTSIKTITLENTVFDLKEDIRDRRRLKNSVLDVMDSFLSAGEKAISDAASSSKEKATIAQYAEKSKSFLRKFIEEGKTKFSDEIFKEITDFEKKVNRVDEENRAILESFFIHDPIPIINKKFIIKATKEGFSSKVKVDCEGDISCIYGIMSSQVPFWNRTVRASDFLKGVEIPARMKKPFLKKEEVPDIIGIDDYLLTDIFYSGKVLEVVFRKKYDIESERFRLKIDYEGDLAVEVYHAEGSEVEKYIQAVPELNAALDVLKLRELGEKIMERTSNLYSRKQRLESVNLGLKDVLEENMIFELMQKVAEIFAPIVALIKKHSPSGEELSLKAEDESGKRSEIYLKKSKVKEKLAPIKEKGDTLLKILNL